MAPACSVCSNRTAPSYYKVARVASNGDESPLTTVCSVRCLISWSYQFMTLQSAKMVWTAKTALAGLFDKLR